MNNYLTGRNFIALTIAAGTLSAASMTVLASDSAATSGRALSAHSASTASRHQAPATANPMVAAQRARVIHAQRHADVKALRQLSALAAIAQAADAAAATQRAADQAAQAAAAAAAPPASAPPATVPEPAVALTGNAALDAATQAVQTPMWACIRTAESGANYSLISGAYGILISSWNAYSYLWSPYGSWSTPGEAPPAVQDYVAYSFYQIGGGYGGWNNYCTGR
ncbi:MAG: hypothetical protein WCI12_06905 [Actinomycetes bacterium]